MSRLLDLEKTEAEWLQEIDKHRVTMQECDMAIDEAQTRRVDAMAEINKYERWIKTAREMFGLNTSDLEEDAKFALSSETTIEKISKSYEDLTIPEAVEKLLQKCSPARLTMTEMTNQLVKGGIKTESADFRNVLQNRLSAMRKKPDKYKWLLVEKEGGENYYSYKN
jgi:hypothetical protein